MVWYWWVILVIVLVIIIVSAINIRFGPRAIKAFKKQIVKKNPWAKDQLDKTPSTFFGNFFWPVSYWILAHEVNKVVAELEKKRKGIKGTFIVSKN